MTGLFVWLTDPRIYDAGTAGPWFMHWGWVGLSGMMGWGGDLIVRYGAVM